MRKCLQRALFDAVERAGVARKVAEIDLGIANHEANGTVWRRIGAATQMVKTTKLFSMIDIAESKGWCKTNDILASLSEVKEDVQNRDERLIDDQLNDWLKQIEMSSEQIESIVLLARFGSNSTKIQIKNAIEKSIKSFKAAAAFI